MNNTTRRNFLKGLAAAAGLGIAAPVAYQAVKSRQTPLAAPAPSETPLTSASPGAAQASASAAPSGQPAKPLPRSLVVLQLAGGNDGLATVFPYSDPAFKDNRPT